MMRYRVWLLAGALLLSGCARLTSTTDLKADGSWTRHIKIARPSAAAQAQPEDKLPDMIRFSGEGWKTSSTTEKSDDVLEGSRSFDPGKAGGDDYVLGVKERPFVACTVKWTTQADGKTLYEETFTWKGDPPDPAREKENRDKLKASLTKSLAGLKPTGAQADQLTDHLMDRLWAELMGPNKPKLFDVILKPEDTLRELRTVFYVQTLADLRAANIGANDAEREAAARALAKDAVENSPFADKTTVEPPSEESDPKKKELGPVQISSSLGFAGKIVETNGDVDVVDGRVYWSIISEACQRGKVTFRALIDTKG